MRLVAFSICLITVIPGWSTVGVDISATQDSVMKVVYTGGSPTGSEPVLSVSGKKIGTQSTANNTSGARGMVGTVSGYSQPSTFVPTGVSGSGGIGVYGKGDFGVYADGGTGIYVLGWGGMGIEITAMNGYGTSGVNSAASNGYYVWGVNASADSGSGQAIGVSGVSGVADLSIGVYGRAEGGTENYAGWFDGDIYVAGDINPSDEMFKKDVTALSGNLGKLLALKPKKYSMKTEEFKRQINLPSGEQFGLLAQEIQAVFPQLVREVTAPVRLTKAEQEAKVKKTSLKFKSVNYNALIPVLIGAMQEQQTMIEALQAEVARLKK